MCTVRDVFDKTGFKDGNFRVHVLTSLKLGGCHEPKLVFILNNGVSVAVLCNFVCMRHIFVDVSRVAVSCCFIDESHVTAVFFRNCPRVIPVSHQAS